VSSCKWSYFLRILTFCSKFRDPNESADNRVVFFELSRPKGVTDSSFLHPVFSCAPEYRYLPLRQRSPLYLSPPLTHLVSYSLSYHSSLPTCLPSRTNLAIECYQYSAAWFKQGIGPFCRAAAKEKKNDKIRYSRSPGDEASEVQCSANSPRTLLYLSKDILSHTGRSTFKFQTLPCNTQHRCTCASSHSPPCCSTELLMYIVFPRS